MYRKIEFMTFEKAVDKLNPFFVSSNEKFEIFPYKWYDLKWLYELPAISKWYNVTHNIKNS
jgi:hypothetical protein